MNTGTRCAARLGLALPGCLMPDALSFSLRGVLCCAAVRGIPLLHCAWFVVLVGVLCCIVVGGDPRAPFLRCARPHRGTWLCCALKHAARIVVRGDLKPFLFLFLSLSLLFEHLPTLRDIHEAPHHVIVLKNPPTCEASRLRRLESRRIALLFRGAWPAVSFAGARPGALRSQTREWLRLYSPPSGFLSRRWGLPHRQTRFLLRSVCLADGSLPQETKRLAGGGC